MIDPASAHRLLHLDGLRGVAALFVTLHHVWQFVVTHAWSEVPPRWFTLFAPLKLGSFGVGVFIVLSGYCLALPVARRSDRALAQGLGGFFWRRARRILPPYYAALVGSALIAALYPPLATPTGTQWDIAMPEGALTAKSWFLHLALLHNLSRDWALAVNPPFWSVALEWQIYFVFALVLLPLWRRFGAWSAVAASVVLGLVPVLAGASFVSSWFLVLFALGMAAASFDARAPGPDAGQRRSIGALSGVLAAVAIVLGLAAFKLSGTAHLVAAISADLLIGASAALHLHQCSERSRRGLPLGWLGSLWARPLLVRLGEFSYSLYLVHFPLLAMLFVALVPLGLALVPKFVVLSLVGVPLLLLAAFCFHLVFERPFQRSAAKRTLVPGAA